MEPTWEEFCGEFERKYFPPEARDRLEAEFMRLEQGERSVREFEAKFTRLRRYVYYGYGDERAIVRKFMQGLKPELRSRLQAVEFRSHLELVERVVNVEESLNAEKEVQIQRQKKVESGKQSAQYTSQTQVSNPGRKRGNNDNRANLSPNPRMVCFACGEVGHPARHCPKFRGTQSSAPGYITCFSCGEKGHYASTCPRNRLSTQLNHVLALEQTQPRPAIEAPAVRPAIEAPAARLATEAPPAKRQATVVRVYPLG